MKKSTFGVLVTTRGIFNPALARQGRYDLLAKLEKQGYKALVLPEDATPSGAIETREDAAKCAKFFQDHRGEIDGVIVCLPNFGDEIGVIVTLELAELNVPVLVQACDDDMDKLGVDGRRDAFCGKLSVCNNLYQYGIRFTNTTFHTCPIESEDFTRDLDYFDRLCRVVRGLRRAKIAQIGTRPTAFQTVRYSEKLLQKAGITVIPVDLSEIIGAADKLAGSATVQAKIDAIKAYGNIPNEIAAEKIERSARMAAAVDWWMQENECVAGAMQCWNSIEQNFGCAACLPMSMLSERLIPMACETDITGAVSMYALCLAAGQPSGYLDWNNNWYRQPNKCINTHCSAYPKSFIGQEIEISPLDVLGKSLGRENCFGGIKGHLVAGPMSFAKVSTDDGRGMVKAYVGEGKFTGEVTGLQGGIAVCEVENLQRLLDYMCQNGYEHHVAMNRSLVADVLAEAFSKYLGWEVYRHR